MDTTDLETALVRHSVEREEFSARLEADELDQIRQVADAIGMLAYLKERSPHAVSDAELSKLIGANVRTTKGTLMELGLAKIVRQANSGPRAMCILTRYAESTKVSLGNSATPSSTRGCRCRAAVDDPMARRTPSSVPAPDSARLPRRPGTTPQWPLAGTRNVGRLVPDRPVAH